MDGFQRRVLHPVLVAALHRDRGERPVGVEVEQHRAPRRTPLSDRLVHFLDHHTVKLLVGAENTFQLLNFALELVALGLQLDPAHLGQSAKPQVENVLRLHLVKVEHRHQTGFRFVSVVGGADDLDHLVDIHQREQQPVNQMQTLQRLLAPEFAAAPDHIAPVRDPHLEHLLETHGVRAPVDKRDVVHGEAVLERRVLEQLRKHGIGVEPGFDFDDQPRAVMPIRQVDCAGNAFDTAVLHTFGNTFQHAFRADHERQLRHHNRLLARRHILDMCRRTGDERATAGLVRLPDAVTADDDAAARPVRPRHIAHELLKRGIGVAHQVFRCLDDLAQIVRGHIGRHTDGDAGRTVDQQVRDGRRQNRRFLELVVVIRGEINGVLVDVRVHAERCRRQPRLGVSRGRGAVIKRAEITVPVHQRQTHRERLGETYHGFINRGIAVRVKLAHHLADHTGRFHVWPIRVQVHLPHLVDDAPLHGLQTVTGVREGTRVNHRVRVFEEGLAHLVLQRRFDDVLLDRTRIIRRACRFAV